MAKEVIVKSFMGISMMSSMRSMASQCTRCLTGYLNVDGIYMLLQQIRIQLNSVMCYSVNVTETLKSLKSLKSLKFSFDIGRHAQSLQEKRLSRQGFEPWQLALVDLKSTPLDQLGHLGIQLCLELKFSKSR